jgi:hypothetical protein
MGYPSLTPSSSVSLGKSATQGVLAPPGTIPQTLEKQGLFHDCAETDGDRLILK